jgi:Protein of unknown function (DUF2955)/Fusaric acid resistance protein-like
MSREAASSIRRHHGLRIAAAVAVGLVFEILRGAMLPPLAPVIALQLLAMPGPAPAGKRVAGLLVVVVAASLSAYAVAGLTAGAAVPYAVGVGLIYLWGFALACGPKTAAAGAMFLTIGIVVSALSAASTDVTLLLLRELLLSVCIGIVLVYLAHASFPYRSSAAGGAKPAAPVPIGRLPPGLRAILATVIMLPLHFYLTTDGLAAFVVLLTVATMLRQPRLEQVTRYGIGFAAGNLMGGMLAALAVFLVSLHDDVLVLVAVAAASVLFMAWQLERRPALAPVLLPGFVAFTLLFGLAFSPLQPSAEVAWLTRVAQIVAAALYALCAISLLVPLAERLTARRQSLAAAG